MKKITTLLALSLSFAVASMAQTVLTVDSANYVDANGVPVADSTYVQVSGIVYGPNSYPTPNGNVFNITSHTRGIKVYSKSKFGYTINDGDSVTVVGYLTTYHGQAEISPSRTHTGDTIILVGTGILDTPRVVTAALLNTPQGESTESMLIKVYDVDMSTVVNWPATHSSHSFTAHATTLTGNLYMFIDSFQAPDLWNGSAPSAGVYTVTGFGSQYATNLPYTNGYSIQPRRRADYVLQTVGIHDIQNPLIASVYPNPASTSVTAAFISATDGDYTVRMTDLTGRVVMTQEGRVYNGDNTLYFNTSSLSNGMYILELNAAGKSLITKMNISK